MLLCRLVLCHTGCTDAGFFHGAVQTHMQSIHLALTYTCLHECLISHPQAPVYPCEATGPNHVWLQPDLHELWKPPPSKDAELAPKEKKPSMAFGQISAVCKGHNDDIWVFHRGEVVWDMATFDPKEDGIHIANSQAFIEAPTVVQLNQVRCALQRIDLLLSTK